MRVVNRERLSAINNPRERNREVRNNGFNLKDGKNQFGKERRTKRFKGRNIDLWFQRRWYVLFIGILAWIFYLSCLGFALLSFLPFSCYSVTRLLTTLATNIFRLLCLHHFFNISRALHSFRISIIPSANECVVYNKFIVPPKWNLELSSLQAYIFIAVETPGIVIKLRKNTSFWLAKNFKAPSIFREGFMG